MYHASLGREFYWIAGLSVLNIVLVLASVGIYFPIGLTVTYIVEEIFWATLGNASTWYYVGSVLFTLIIAGLFFLFGFLTTKGKMVALWIGVALYIVDLLLALAAGFLLDYPSLFLDCLFHAYMLFLIFRLFFGLRKVNAIPDDKKSNGPIDNK